MKTQIYNHRNGEKIVPEDIINGILEVLHGTNSEIKLKITREFRNGLYEQLYKKGWSDEMRLDTESHITLASYMKGVGLCIQTGNAARIYADLLKMQTLFVKGKISSGIIVVPQNETAKKMGKGMANYERLLRELPIFSQVITMPIVVIGFEGDQL